MVSRKNSASLVCRMMSLDDADGVSALIVSSFDEFIGHDYSEQGIAEFRQYVDAEAIRQRIQHDHFVMVAESEGILAGMIEIRDCNHVALLFVGKEFHRRGVARLLVDQAVHQARVTRPDLARVTLNSSRHGVPAYERIGFRQTGPERSVNGIVFIPMAIQLDA